MGCDFYTYYIMCIECTDKSISKYIIHDTLQRHYWDEFVNRDEDFDDEDFNKQYKEYCDMHIKRELALYITKDLYNDGKWLCTEYAVSKYRDILDKLKISEKDVIHIWKQGESQLI
jgi:hypothetical protein